VSAGRVETYGRPDDPLDGVRLLAELLLEDRTSVVVWLFGALGVGFIAAGVWLLQATDLFVVVPGLFVLVGVVIVAVPVLVPGLAELG
jgi:hypothetical protein